MAANGSRRVSGMNISPLMQRNAAFWLASGFGVGLAPKAPGTVGSIVALLPWLALRELPLPAYLAAVLLTFAVGVWAASQVIAQLKVDDPGVVVLDEWVGLWLALTLAPPGWLWPLLGLVLFRLFDIVKPWPVSWADTHLSGGFGAMFDDALAGVYAFLALQLLAWFAT